jgi:cysteine desulfurase / selenocysteine lyase
MEGPVREERSLESIRKDFPALNGRRNGKPPIYFDNACTTLVPRQVIDAINEYYSQFPACGGRRCRHWFSEEVTNRIEGDDQRGIRGARRIIKDFINAGSENEIIFTTNTSHAINIVALGYKFEPGDVVLVTDKEHNSNLVPWLRLQKSGQVGVRNIREGQDGDFDFEAFEQKLRGGLVKLVSMAYTSNLTGYTLPAKQIVELAHRYGAKVLLDGAQTVPHRAVDVQDLDVDFLAFSIHKMCGPRGVGVLYGKKGLLGSTRSEGRRTEGVIEPVMLGGGTVGNTTYDSYDLLGPPESFEVGVQDYAGQIGAGAAINYIKKIGMDRISSHEARLNSHLTDQLKERYGGTGWFRILGPRDPVQRGPILTFEVKRPNAFGIAEELDKMSNVMIRDGALCVHSYLNKELGKDWMRPGLPTEHRMIYRVSLYFYNTIEECQTFSKNLGEIFDERSYL